MTSLKTNPYRNSGNRVNIRNPVKISIRKWLSQSVNRTKTVSVLFLIFWVRTRTKTWLSDACNWCCFLTLRYHPHSDTEQWQVSVFKFASSYINNTPRRFLQNFLPNCRQFLSVASHYVHHRVQLCVCLQSCELRWVSQHTTGAPALFLLRSPQDFHCYLDR